MKKRRRFKSVAIVYVLATGVALVGLILLVLGLLLATSGGSAFYLISGALLSISGVQLFRRRASTVHFVALNFALTWIWALIEVQFDGWALLPRPAVSAINSG